MKTMKLVLNGMMEVKLLAKGKKMNEYPTVELYMLCLSELKDEIFTEYFTGINKRENFNYEEALEYIQGQVDSMKKGGLI